MENRGGGVGNKSLLSVESALEKIIKDKKFYDNIRDMKVKLKKKEEDEKFKLLEYRYRS